MNRKKFTTAIVAIAALAYCSVAFAAKPDSYSGKLTSDRQTTSYMGADVFVNDQDKPKKISIGFSSANASCGESGTLNGQTGGIQNEKLKKQGKKFTFKGTADVGPGTSTIEGTLSANGKKITGDVDYTAVYGGVITCSFSNEPFKLKFDGKEPDEPNEND